ncbi:MAG: enoyl-CoA hydratase/isomerase family protein [Austwickia sp.]|jgi:2-(1,2-epoxy-1,2-dihydrophenyl)acetyl-CoA isomerase|nr:enoyl-CoA hydratase/isomerase family protein [Austwickia sp.]
MSEDVVLVTVEDGVGCLRLNRPAAANALNAHVGLALQDAVRRLSVDPDVGSVLVSGAGKRFCAGGDMAAMAGADDPAAFGRDLADNLDVAFQALASLPKPTVVVVQGAVAGAGLALMLSCDIVIAEQSTRFRAAYPSVGLTPDTGLSWLLPRAIGTVRALDLLLTNRLLTAAEARAMGLAARVVEDGHGYDIGAGIAADLAAGPTYALGCTKTLVRSSWESDRGTHGQAESRAIHDVAGTPFARDAIARFSR